MKYVELFAGVGGFRLGIERAFMDTGRNSEAPNTKVRQHQSNVDLSNGDGWWSNATCVFSNEWDKYAAQTYNKNFGGQINEQDITTIDAKDTPDHDLLVGGFPCQAFSIAGKRLGFNETRGTMFFEIARILAEKRPRHLVLENVKGLLSHDSGKTFQTILGVLSDLGYRVEWQVLNSKDFGVPQNRERVFIIGHLRDECRCKVFPLGEDGNSLTKKNRYQLSESAISGTLTATDHKMHLDGTYIKQINQPKHSNQRVYSDDGISPTLNTMQGGNRQPFIAAQRGRENGQQLEPRKDGLTNTITSVAKDNYVMPKIRRLTPVECERLQGFPDNWTEGVSDTQRYKQMGNAVTVNVVEAIMRKLYE